MFRQILDAIYAFFNNAPNVVLWPISQKNPITLFNSGEEQLCNFERTFDYDESHPNEFQLILKDFSKELLPYSQISLCFDAQESGRYKSFYIPDINTTVKDMPVVYLPWNFNLTEIHTNVTETDLKAITQGLNTIMTGDLEYLWEENCCLILCDRSDPTQPRVLFISLDYIATEHYTKLADDISETFRKTKGKSLRLKEYDLEFHIALMVVEKVNKDIQKHTDKKAQLVNRGNANEPADFYIELEE